jgi:lipoprotein signal peptidase
MNIKLKFRGVWDVPVVLILDRLFKAWAARASGMFVIVPGILGFRYAENTGAAFSMFSGITAILAIVTAILVALVTLYLFIGKSIPIVARYALWLVVASLCPIVLTAVTTPWFWL